MSDTPPDDLLQRIEASAELLESIVADRGVLIDVPAELRERLMVAAGQASRPDKAARRALERARQTQAKLKRRAKDEAVLDQTGIRKLRESPVFLTPRLSGTKPLTALPLLPSGGPQPSRPLGPSDHTAAPAPIGEVHEERRCYVCREPFREVHAFYDQLCPGAGARRADLWVPRAPYPGHASRGSGREAAHR